MKTAHLTLCLLCFFTTHPIFSTQFWSKRRVNYDSFGDLTATDVSSSSFEADAKVGFHLGVFTNIDLLTFTSDLNCNSVRVKSTITNNGRLALNKIEAPVLLGYKALGPLSVFVGLHFNTLFQRKEKM